MAIVLGANQYGKAEVRLVHVDRSGPEHVLRDVNVSSALRGDFADAHLTGDNAHVLATDTQKNTVYAFARDGVGEVEDFGLRLARHFAGSYPWISGARVMIDEYGWARIGTSPHAFVRASGERRTTVVTIDGDASYVVSGVSDLVVLKTTGSEFHGFPRDRYTTLAETDERILATAVTARWRYGPEPVEWGKAFGGIREALLEAFADTHSLALQQTLYAMGSAVLESFPAVAEIRLSMPNKHHYLVDLTPFDLDNPNEVYIAGDRPYGLIEAVVTRDDAPPAGPAWDAVPAFA